MDDAERAVLESLEAAKTAFDIMRRSHSGYTLTDQGMFDEAIGRARLILIQAESRNHEHQN